MGALETVGQHDGDVDDEVVDPEGREGHGLIGLMPAFRHCLGHDLIFNSVGIERFASLRIGKQLFSFAIL